MDQKFSDFISCLNYDEVLDLKQDLSVGGLRVKKIVNQKIKEYNSSHRKICATCLSDLSPDSSSNYTLLFGPESFKKKASFCAIDCLDYFVKHLSNMKKSNEFSESSENYNNGEGALEEFPEE